MAERSSVELAKAEAQEIAKFELRRVQDPRPVDESEVHVYRGDVVCATDTRGYETPGNRSKFDLWIDAPDGRIPLWAKGITLRWRFQELSLEPFDNPDAVKAQVRKLLGKAVMAWGTAAPVKFTEAKDNWDFEVAIREEDRCSIRGCVLARAFFPDAGQHDIAIYPKMFSQDPQEQVETLIHELGHVFGLRHFFANISETDSPSVLFGKNSQFSIMNYGADSKLTSADRNDLARLYQLVWSGQLTEINGTKIKLMEPFHSSGASPESVVAVGQIQAAIQPVGEHASAA